ncbi:MAG: substrate-binding domain-containing protein [Armatimonadota bacterium]|nr:substrate-binding domain-containing protein [Armatimonadota bacterium]
MRLLTLLACVVLAVALALGGCGGKKQKAAENYRFTFVIYGTAGNPFWTKVVNGAKEAADKIGCSVDIQYADNDATKQNDIIETAMANKVDGIGMAINYDDAYDELVKKCLEQGIAVVAFNIDDSKRAAGNSRMAYIGQDMESAGFIIANRLINDGKLKKGDLVVCPVEHPDAVYARQRYAGARRAFDAVGIKSEVLNTGGVSLEDTLNKLTQYLLGHKDTDAILGMGGMPMEVAPQATAEAGMKIPNAGFDLTKQIATNITDGKSIATVDQQPFYQGFLTITQLYYNRKYGLHPCDVNTGGGVVDKTNVKQVLEFADTTR